MLRRVGVSLVRANLVRSCGVSHRLYRPILVRSLTTSRFCYNKESDDLVKKTQDLEINDREDHFEDLEVIAEKEALAQLGRDNEEALTAEEQVEEEIEEDFEEDSERVLTPEEIAERAQEEIARQEKVEETDSDDVPWYLREDEASELDTSPIFKTEIPDVPEGAPSQLEDILNYAAKDLGLDNIKIFDIRDREELPAASYADFMILFSGKSPKHIQKAVDELVAHLKSEYKIIPYVEGLLKANSFKRQKRRIKRKVRTSSYIDTEFGVGPNSWVMIDPKIDGLMLHIMTPERRKEVNLELLWCKREERSQYLPKYDEENIADDVDSIFHGLQRRYYTTGVDLSPSTKALQQLMIGDVKGLKHNLRKLDLETRTELLQGIIYAISSMNMSQAFEILELPDNIYIRTFNNAFPFEPELRHWEQRYQLYSLLNKLLPSTYPISHLAHTLQAQASYGEAISDIQFERFLDDLLKTPEFPTSKNSQDQLNDIFRAKFRYLSEILIIKDVQSTFKITPKFLTKLLQLASQNPEGPKSPVSRFFKVILELFPDLTKSDQGLIYLTLESLAEAHETETFWKFWDNLKSYRFNGSEVVYDARPWKILINIVLSSKNGKLIGTFIEDQVPILINNGILVDEEMAEALLLIFEEHGGSSARRDALDEYLSSNFEQQA